MELAVLRLGEALRHFQRRLTAPGPQEPADGRHAALINTVTGIIGDMDIAGRGLYHLHDPNHLFVHTDYPGALFGRGEYFACFQGAVQQVPMDDLYSPGYHFCDVHV